MVKVKICGMTNLEDTLLAVKGGADAVGFIFYKKSLRNVSAKTVKTIVAALPPFIETVGVFVNESADRINRIVDSCKLSAVQLHGNESPAFCKKIRRKVIKAVRVKGKDSFDGLSSYKVSAFLLDACSDQQQGGTGETFDWRLVSEGKKYGPVILAGGLDPSNVAHAIQKVKPYGVDVCSGVEKIPGIKDPSRLKEFIKAAKSGKSLRY
ncbi:MAG: phosphoribosylanthranilate isomerase [Nitrospinae bacterium]|nr:phosphoribosylanthranilate isomerase [Nitrospinota bacterium]